MRAAVIQMNSGADRPRNLETAERLLRAAAADGAELAVLPEKWSLLATGETLLAGAEGIDGEAITASRSWAAELGIGLLAGSFTERSADGLPGNTSVLISPDGDIEAVYRKIHMFDVDVGGVSYRESSFERAGDEIVVAGDGPARIGLAVCYDLRFPELFRALLDRDANVFTLPSAFTAATGRDHWRPLIQARAIENQAFVLAANQVGRADPEFDSWGDSLIADPWGRIIARVGEGEGFAAADLDFDALAETRASLPATSHRRGDLFPAGNGES